MDADSGRVLYEKNADERSLIASTTKIMTALLVCEQCNLSDSVQIPKEAVGVEGSSLYLQEGEILSVQELLYGLMLHSGNDAAVALAIYCAGSEAAFVDRMNEKAQRLGLTGTSFGNPHGLDHDGNYSTARDLAKLSAYAMENEDFYRTVSCKTVNIGNRSLRNHNKLLFRYDGMNVSEIDMPFTDVAEDAYYAEAVKWAFENEIINGVGNDRYDPDRPVSRQEMAKIFTIYLGLEPGAPVEYKDQAQIAAWAEDYVRAVTNHGLMQGSGGSFRPNGTATRAEIATILMRLDEE